MSDLIPPSTANQTTPHPHHPEVPPVESNVLGISFAMELGSIMAVPAVVFGLTGRYLDKYFGMGNTFFFLALALAFTTSFMTAYKKVKEIMDRMPKDLPAKKKEKVDQETAKEQEVLHDLFRPPSA